MGYDRPYSTTCPAPRLTRRPVGATENLFLKIYDDQKVYFSDKIPIVLGADY